MANLEDLKNVSVDLAGIIKNLFNLAKSNSNVNDKTPENAVVQSLKQVVATSNQPTPASSDERAEAIGKSYNTLSTILEENLDNSVLSETTITIIKAEQVALQDALGLLAARITFEDIPQLLPESKIKEISATMEEADKAIAQRQRAKDILDAIITVTITAANIASKVA